MQLFIIGVLAALGLLVLIHELGHYSAARLFGVVVEKFSIGFGPKLFGFKKWNTNFLVSLIPLGGYVKMKGDEPEEGGEFKDDEFYGKAWWKRAIIVFAGPFANLILGFLLFVMSFMVGRVVEDQKTIIGIVNEKMQEYFQPDDKIVSVNGKSVKMWGEISQYLNSGEENEFVLERAGEERSVVVSEIEAVSWYTDILPSVPATVGSVAPGMPAYRSGLLEGDIVLRVGEEEVSNWYEMRNAIISYPDDRVELLIEREGAQFDVTVPLETNLLDEEGHKMIGITQHMGEKYFEKYSIRESIRYGYYSSVNFIILNYQALFKMISRPFLAKDGIGGPVMILTMSKQTSQLGLGAIIAFVASISMVLMMMNLLPIPILDGGHIFFFFIEGITKKMLSYKVQAIVQQIGFMILIALMIFAFYNDISKVARRSLSLKFQQMEETADEIID